jgi:hypothetical protein
MRRIKNGVVLIIIIYLKNNVCILCIRKLTINSNTTKRITIMILQILMVIQCTAQVDVNGIVTVIIIIIVVGQTYTTTTTITLTVVVNTINPK